MKRDEFKHLTDEQLLDGLAVRTASEEGVRWRDELHFRALERQVKAAERAATATERYARLTFWVAVFTGATALATFLTATIR
jgi:hypothetical protein